MSYLQLALLFLKLANLIMERMNSAAQFQAGVDSEVARVAQIILRRTQAGKAIMEKVDGLSEADVDDGLHGLEPK